MILGTILPNNALLPFEAVKCWFALPKYDICYHQGSTLSNNRNQVWKYAQMKKDSLLFIDSDIVFQIKDVLKMEKLLQLYDVVTGVYTLTFPPYHWAIFKRIEGDYEFFKPTEFCEVGACGGGFLGVSSHAVEVLGDNPFSNQWEGEIQHGEDVSFCHLAREKGLKIWCDPNIKVGQVRMEVKYPLH